VVITSLLRVVPIFGDILVSFIWGGFMVRDLTLKFFFSLHFLLPWLIFVLVFMHLLFLHRSGRRSTFSDYSFYFKVNFFLSIGERMGLICFVFGFFYSLVLFFRFYWVIQRYF